MVVCPGPFKTEPFNEWKEWGGVVGCGRGDGLQICREWSQGKGKGLEGTTHNGAI